MTTHFNEATHADQISVPFDPACREALVSGQQTVTTRRKMIGLAGSKFLAFGMVFEIVRVEPSLLEMIAANFYAQEGYPTPDAFKIGWAARHPRRGWTPGHIAYMHEIRRVL